MKEEDCGEDKTSYKKMIFSVILAIIIYSFYSENGIFNLIYGIDAAFIVLPAITAIIIYIFSEIIGYIFEGNLILTLKVSLHFLMIGLFVFLLIDNTPFLSLLNSAAQPILYLSILISLYYIFSSGIEENKSLSTALKSTTIVVLGFFSRNLSLALFPNQIEIFGESLATMIANSVFLGLIFVAGGFIFLYKNKQNPHSLLEKDVFHILSFIVGSFIGFYVFGLRSYLEGSIGSRLLLLEWSIVIGLGIVGFLKILQDIRSREKTKESWTPHQKVERVLQDKKREEILKAMEEFLENGSKEKIIVYLIFRESRKEKSWTQIFYQIKELLEYEDLEPSPILSRWTKEKVKKKNKKRRKDVLEKTIEKIEEE